MANERYKMKEKESFEFKVSSTTEQLAEKQIAVQREERLIAQNGYEMESLSRENELLSRQLQDAELWQEQDLRFAERDKSSMQTRVTRNQMILLYNDSKFSQDSKEMQDIKTSMVELDGILRQTEWDASDVFSSYNRVIGYMRHYEMVKHPFFPAGKRRKARVSALRAALEAERERFMTAVATFQEGQMPASIKSPMDVLEGKHIGDAINGGAEERLSIRKRKLLGLKREDGKADGAQMRNIKEKFKELYTLLGGRIGAGDEGIRQRNDIQEAYRRLLADCNAYIKDHHPRTQEGKERLAFVQELKDRFEIEQMYLSSLKEEQVAEKGENALWIDVFGAADAITNDYFNAKKEIGSAFSNRTAPAKALTFVYSLYIISDSEQAKHQILKNEIAQNWYDTYMNGERYKEMLLYSEKLKADIADLFRNEVKNPVPLQFLKDENMDPMDLKSREAYTRLCLRDHPKMKLYRGLVNALSGYITANSMDEGDNSLKEQGKEFVSKYKESLPAQEREKSNENDSIALSISNLDGMSVLKETAVSSYRTVMENRERSECKENLKDFVSADLLDLQAGEKQAADQAFEDMKKDTVWKNAEAVFEKARALGMEIPALRDVQKSKLMSCDSSMLGREICAGLDFIQGSLSHYGNEAVSEYDAKKKEIYYKVAAKTLLRFANVSDEGAIAAEYELSKFLSETVFELAGKQVLKEVSEKAYIGDLATFGAGGIFRAVEEKRAEVEAWQNKKMQVDMGVTHLADLCNDLHEISDLFAKAFVSGLTNEEAERVKAVGTKIDTLLSSQEDLAAMDLVAKGLKGLRYETGFSSLKTLFEGGFRYKEAAEQIAAEMLLPEEEQQRMREQNSSNPPVQPEAKKEEKESKKKKEEVDQTFEGVLNVLEAKVIPSVLMDNLSEKEKSSAPAIAAGYMEMQKALRSFKTGENSVKEIQVGTAAIRLVHHNDGSIDLVYGEKVTALTNNAAFMAERLEADITSNIRLYGKEAAYQIIVANEKNGYAGKTTLRSMCLHAIEGVSTLSGSYFNNITTEEVIRISKYLLKDGMTEAQVREYVESIEDSAQINGEETLTLLKDMEKQQDVDSMVIIPQQIQKNTEEEDGWTEQERGIIDLVSDIVFTQDTWIADETRMQPGQRLQKLILSPKHMGTLVYLIQNKYNHGLDQMLEKLNIPADLKKTVKDFIDVFLGDKQIEENTKRLEGLEGEALEAEVTKMHEEMESQQKIKDELKKIIEAGDEKKEEKKPAAMNFFGGLGNFFGKLTKAITGDPVKAKNIAVEAALRMAITGITATKPELFADLEKKIDAQVEEAAGSIQMEVNKNVDVLFSGRLEDEEQAKQPVVQNAEANQQPVVQNAEANQQPVVQNAEANQQPVVQNAEANQQQEEEKEEDEEEEALTKLQLNMEKPLDPNEKGISEEEKTRRKEYKKKYKQESRKKLAGVIAENYVTGKRGQGKFLRLVLSNYFAGVSTLDKRSMLAGAIRATKPAVKLPEDATEAQMQQAVKDMTGAYLGGILKGAGPLLQKMLQGIPMIGLPKELQSALEDMKSRLAPIPPQIVKAQMLDMVKRSNGRVTKIEVTRALGAASVGQTFLCKMYGPGFENGKDVVVKLLRPDVRNRMMREKSLMRDCARITDKNGGMLATYEGQLLRIEEELDLTIEAANVEKGICYDKHGNTVKSMKVDHTIDPTATSMVLEKAPGTTIDAYMKSVAKEKKEIMSQFYQYTEKTENGKTVKEPVMVKIEGEDMIQVAYNVDTASKIAEAQEKIQNMLEKLQKRQEYMADLARIWVEEGIFKNGFYHGDLHAGNIMIDDEKVTVIDFGNATKLDADQQLHLTRVIMSAAAGNVSEFQIGFHALLKGADPKIFEEYERKKDQLTQVFEEVMKLGDATTTGERIGACLIRAQELGVAIPAAINNFVQSQLRIQNAIAEMNAEIKDLQRCATQIFTIGREEKYVPGADIVAKLHSNLMGRNGKWAELLSEMKQELQGEIDREAVKKDFLTITESDEFYKKHLNGVVDVGDSIENVRDFMDAVKTASENGQSAAVIKSMCEPVMEELKKSFDKLEKHCNKARVQKIRKFARNVEDTGVVDGVMDELYEALNMLDPDGIYKNTRKEYLKLRNLRPAATQEEKDQQMNAFLDQLAAARKKAYISGHPVLSSIKDNIGIMYNKEAIAQIDKELEPYFNDLENGGAMLRKVFNEIREAQAAQRSYYVQNKEHFAEVEAQKTEEFLALMHKLALKKIDDYGKRAKKGVDVVSDPRDFFSVMGQVLFENKSAALDRLGGYLAIWRKYRNITNQVDEEDM